MECWVGGWEFWIWVLYMWNELVLRVIWGLNSDLGCLAQYFYRGLFILNIQRERVSGLTYSMLHSIHVDNMYWYIQWPHSCECGKSCVPVIMSTPSLSWGLSRVTWEAFFLRIQGVHWWRLQMGWSVSVGTSIEGVIYIYLISTVSTEQFQVSGICRVSHLCPSLWHKRWCYFGVATYEIYEDLLLIPLHVMRIDWYRCCPFEFYVGLFSIFRPVLMNTNHNRTILHPLLFTHICHGYCTKYNLDTLLWKFKKNTLVDIHQGRCFLYPNIYLKKFSVDYCCCFLLFVWPPAHAVCPNYEVVMLQPRSGTVPSLGSVASFTY